MSLTSQNGLIGKIQTSRTNSATDTCYLFRTVINAASALQGKQAAGTAFLNSVGLGNCEAFGKRVTRLK